MESISTKIDVSARRHEMHKPQRRFVEHDVLILLAAVSLSWVYGFQDMIEFECTLPYIKVSACCKHFIYTAI